MTIKDGLPLPLIPSRAYGLSTTKDQTDQLAGVSRGIRKQHPGKCKCLGFLTDVRAAATADSRAGGSDELSEHLFEPAAGEGVDDDPAAKRAELREGVRRDQAGPADGAATAKSSELKSRD